MSSTLKNYLAQLKVKDFPATTANNGNVVVVKTSDNLKSTMNLLNEHNIYSAPVFDDDKNQYVGMIDMIDIADFIVDNFEHSKFLGPGFEAIFDQAQHFLEATVADVANLSKRNLFVPVSEESNLLSVVNLLTENRVHRVCVFGSDDKTLVNIITQSAVIDFVNRHNFSAVEKKTVEELKLGTTPVLSVDINSPTIDAFRLLRQAGVYAVPIINKSIGKQIVANISCKDARAAAKDPSKIHLLYAPLSQFLAEKNKKQIDIETPSITCSSNDTIRTVIDRIVANRIHRVYVLDKTNAPQAIITLTDVLKALLKIQ